VSKQYLNGTSAQYRLRSDILLKLHKSEVFTTALKTTDEPINSKTQILILSLPPCLNSMTTYALIISSLVSNYPRKICKYPSR